MLLFIYLLLNINKEEEQLYKMKNKVER